METNAGAGRKIRVLIVDDHPHGREGMREIIGGEPDFEIVGEADNGERAVAMAAALGPELVLMDINMPVMNGMEATQYIKSIDPQIKIVMVTVSDDVTDLFEAIKRGAQGYLLKNLSPSAWIEYLRAVAVDEAPMSRELAFRLLQEFAGGAALEGGKRRQPLAAGYADARSGGGRPLDASGRAFGGSVDGTSRERAEAGARLRQPGTTGAGERLTPREREVLERVASGESNRQIAASLGLSEHTVKNHLKNILQKLHLDNRVQLTRFALQEGLLD